MGATSEKHRPKYHFLPGRGWMNDPNGFIYWRGRYHLFYQYNPNGAFHGTIHWGHASSEDLVAWLHHPVALTPTPGSPDEDGCYSGCAFTDDDGTPTIMYTGVRGDEQLPCIARATDPQMLTTWEKYRGNPVIPSTPDGLETVAFRDHSLWKDGEFFYQAIGAGIRGEGGCALLYRSKNLTEWEYLNPLYTGCSNDTIWSGSMWECPDFFALGESHFLVVSVWHREVLHYSTFFAGGYGDGRFTPESQGMMDFGDVYYAPQSMLDGAGRRIVIGWLRDGRDDETARESGWSGAMSLPRLLSTGDGGLRIEPVPELEKLRRERTPLVAGRLSEPPTVSGEFTDALEVFLEVERAGRSPLLVELRHASGETTTVTCDPSSGIANIASIGAALPERHAERQAENFAAACNAEPVTPGSGAKLRLFFDVSVVEVFFGAASCTAGCVYPEDPAVVSVSVSCVSGDTWFVSGEVWIMNNASI